MHTPHPFTCRLWIMTLPVAICAVAVFPLRTNGQTKPRWNKVDPRLQERIRWREQLGDPGDGASRTAMHEACPGAGDCYGSNGTGSPACNDENCCNSVCDVDPFCCDVIWDSFCANEALAICDCPGCECQAPSTPPDNDECSGAVPIIRGNTATAIDNRCATVSPPDHPTCNDGFLNGMGLDIWYEYQAGFTGSLVVSTCNQLEPDWDSQIAIYDTGVTCDCNLVSDPPLGCNDDFPGCTSGSSQVVVDVTDGNCYMIRIGSSFTGISGLGTLTLSEGPMTCDLSAAIPGCSTAELEACGTDTNGGCNSDGSSECCSSTVPPGPVPDCGGCDDAVCACDPSCCAPEGTWSSACANLAHDLTACQAYCPSSLEPASCGGIIHGTAWAEGGTRDTDWYELVITRDTYITLKIESEFPYVVGFIEKDPDIGNSCLNECSAANGGACPGGCAAATGYVDPAISGTACQADNNTVSAGLSPGTHWLFVAPSAFDGLPCNAGANDYVLSIDCGIESITTVTTHLITAKYYAECQVRMQVETPCDVASNLASILFSDITTFDPNGFYQDVHSSDTAPSQIDIDAHPTLAHDSFVTIGLQAVPQGTVDGTTLDPSWNTCSFNCLNSPNPCDDSPPAEPGECGQAVGGWYNNNSTNGQGQPDGNRQVLIGQFTVRKAYGVSGLIDVRFDDDRQFNGITFTCAPCLADIDGDGLVGPADLAQLLGRWGPCPAPCVEENPKDPSATCLQDLNGDCVVGSFDLAILLGSWGPC